MFEELLIILFVSVVAVSLLRKASLPPILGYLFTGILVSPYWLGIIGDSTDLRAMSEFGVVFLLFMIGLELSMPKLISMRRNLIVLGGGQVLLTTVLIIAIFSFVWSLSLPGAIAIAAAITLSSTAVVTKELLDQSALQSRYGQLILSILLFQDLAAVPFLIIIPTLAEGGDNIASQLYTTIPMGVLVVIILLSTGRYILKPLYHIVAAGKSSELFMMATLLVALASAGVTDYFDLHKELGAFLAGVMLAETQYAHQIETDIQPFRDVLLGLFFVTVGLQLDPLVVVIHWKTIIAIVCSLVLIKTTVVYSLAYFVGGHDRVTSFKAGLALAQGGEFGFAILTIETARAILPSEKVNIITAVIIISIGLAPILIRKSEVIARFIFGNNDKKKHFADIEAVVGAQPRRDHVIICGYGRMGHSLALFLEQENIPYIGIELDPDCLEEALMAEEPIYYGDATKEETLLGAGLLQARLVMITFQDAHRTRKMLKFIRFHQPSIPVLVRARDDKYLTSLQQCGATEVISESLESSLMMASHMLLCLGLDAESIHKKIAHIKSYRYHMMRTFYQQERLDVPADKQTFSRAILIDEESFACGKTLAQLTTPHFPALIQGLTRGGIRSTEPHPDMIFEAGDILTVEGTEQQIFAAQERLEQGV